MSFRKTARRYTLALYESALEKKQTEEVRKDFSDILALIKSSNDFRTFLISPVITPERKTEIIKLIFGGKVQELTENFLRMLCLKNRINILPEISEDFLDLVNEKKGIAKAVVKTAVEISDSQKKSIEDILRKFSHREISAEYKTEPEIIGGFIAQIGDRIIDASIKRQLELLKQKLTQGTFNN
ncbi:MAG: ATP synthase F1 subunit delta [Ignavibacteria bacterium]|nr:ATP synthase F1 subunit delta [Ignavibacteria bacterium]